MGCSNMKLKTKQHKSYNRQVLDAIQQELGRDDIGLISRTVEGIRTMTITDMNSEELTLTTSEEARIKALSIVREKLT